MGFLCPAFKAMQVEVAIYDCDWYSAPLPFRRLVLMFMVRCKKPITVRAKPFYTMNLLLLSRVSGLGQRNDKILEVAVLSYDKQCLHDGGSGQKVLLMWMMVAQQ